MNNNQNKKTAIVYDWIDSWGGVERVLLDLHSAFPAADFYTSYVDLRKAPWAKDLKIHPSFIQRLPNFIKKNRKLSLPLYPFAFESLNLSQYDLVISVSSAFAKSIITRPHTRHICYLLTPPRYLWGQTDTYGITNAVAAPLIHKLREFDVIAAQRPDKIISISQTVADRCKTYYRRDSDVLFPPFDIAYWKDIKSNVSKLDRPQKNPYYLVVSRLEPYKKVDLVIETFKNRKETLIIIGKGTQKDHLVGKAGNNVRFLENLSDEELAQWYMHAEALIMAQEEDFGYVALEAQMMGCPVVAYKSGGALETVRENVSGVFFASQSQESLEEALERLRVSAYNVRQALQAIEPFLESFDKESFKNRLQKYISSSL